MDSFFFQSNQIENDKINIENIGHDNEKTIGR